MKISSQAAPDIGRLYETARAAGLPRQNSTYPAIASAVGGATPSESRRRPGVGESSSPRRSAVSTSVREDPGMRTSTEPSALDSSASRAAAAAAASMPATGPVEPPGHA